MRARSLALAISLAACSLTATTTGLAASPEASADPALTGSWFTGSISSIQMYDPVSGQFADPNGEGFYFIFRPDGSYREGAVISNTQGICSMRLLGENQGTWAVADTIVTLDQSGGSISIANTCGDSGTYAQPTRRTIYTWAVGSDDDGTETLSLTAEDGTPYAAFQRWED